MSSHAKDSQKIKIKTKTPRITDEGWNSQKQAVEKKMKERKHYNIVVDVMSLEWIRLAIIETLMYSLDEIHQSLLLNIRYIHIYMCTFQGIHVLQF